MVNITCAEVSTLKLMNKCMFVRYKMKEHTVSEKVLSPVYVFLKCNKYYTNSSALAKGILKSIRNALGVI